MNIHILPKRELAKFPLNALTLTCPYCMLTKGIIDKVFMSRFYSFISYEIDDLSYCFPQKTSYHSRLRGCVLMRHNDRRPFKAMALMSAILSQLVGAILLGVFAGRWFDRLLETEPLFLIIGLLLGLTVGIYAMLRLIQQFFSGE